MDSSEGHGKRASLVEAECLLSRGGERNLSYIWNILEAKNLNIQNTVRRKYLPDSVFFFRSLWPKAPEDAI